MKHSSTTLLIAALALFMSASCSRNAAGKTNDGGDLIEQTSPVANTTDDKAEKEEDAPERFEALYTSWAVSPQELEALEGMCEVPAIAQFAKPVACWSSKQGWLEDFEPCVGKTRPVFTTTADALEVGERVQGCDHNGDTLEGMALMGELPERYYYGMLATSKQAVTRAKSLCEVVELSDMGAGAEFERLRFDEEVMASILARYEAREVPMPACIKQLEGKSLPELLDAKTLQTNDAYMKAQLDKDAALETLLPLHMFERGCEVLMILKEDEGKWSVARYADPGAQVGEEGWSYYFATDTCTDLDDNGVAEIWLPNGGETERAYHLVTPEKGVLRDIGKPHHYGD
ncbi:MAG: hypothetical protein VYE40_14830 [Myxococcota bacterium]|nr:hypothetical protein [Myxococcota bacterium]